MGKVRVRKESNKLFLDFRYEGQRFREQTLLDDNNANRKQLERLLQRMEAKMLLEQFNYADFFPNSRNLKKLGLNDAKGKQATSASISKQNSGSTETPRFSDFADQWLEESKIEWRASHCRNVCSILDSSLKPELGKTPVGDITKADIMAFRAKLAKRRGRGTNGLLSPKTINSHMTVLRTVLDEAAERFGFDTPYKNIKPLKLRKTHIEPFSLHEVQRIIDNVRPDYRDY